MSYRANTVNLKGIEQDYPDDIISVQFVEESCCSCAKWICSVDFKRTSRAD